MCYNCGCGLPEDDMGQGNMGVDPNGKSITNKSIDVSAKSQGLNKLQTMKNMRELLDQEIKKEEK